MAGRLRVTGGTPTVHSTRRRSAATIAVVVLALLVTACSPAPAAIPTTPGASAAPASAAAASTAPSPADATSSPPPSTGWTDVVPAEPATISATFAAVSGNAAATDPRAGFRLRATGATPLATLLGRLRVEPSMAYTVTTASDGRSAILRPNEALAARSTWRFTLVDERGAAITGWGFQVAGPPQVVGTTPYDEATEVPVTAGIEITFDQEGVVVESGDIIVRQLGAANAVAGRLEVHGRATVFVPARRLAAGATYSVTVRAGTGATAGHAGLPRDHGFSFATARIVRVGSIEARIDEPFVSTLVGEHALLRANHWKNLPDGDTTRLTTPVRTRVYRLPDEAAALRALGRLLAAPEWAGAELRPTVSTAGLTRVFAGKASFVEGLYGDHRLRVPVAGRAGWYLVELRETLVSQAIVQVTDTLVTAGVRDDRLVAWVNDARRQGPVAGATVAVVGGARLGRTDAQGMLVAPTSAAVAAATGPVLLRVSGGGSRPVITMLAGSGELAPRESWGSWSDEGVADWWTALSTDRWLYRPTDTIQAWGYLRRRADDARPAAIRVRVWRDTDGPQVGAPVTTADVTRSATGAWIAAVPLRDLPYGLYSLEVLAEGRRVEAVGFEVGDVRKPPYRLEIATAPRAFVVGTATRATVTATFFDGTPAAGVDVAVGLEDVDESEVRTGATNVRGTATVATAPDPLGEEDDWEQLTCRPLRARPAGAVEAYVEAGEDVCITRGEELVDATLARTGDVLTITGAVHHVDFAAIEAWLVAPDREERELDARGAPVARRRVEIRVTETVVRRVVESRWYDPITKQVVESYAWEDASEQTRTHVATTNAAGTFRLRVTAPTRNRSWSVTATVVDAAGHRVATRAWDSTAQAEPHGTWWYGLSLAGDRNEVRPGEKVTATVVRSKGGNDSAMPVGGVNRYLFLGLGPSRFDARVSRKPASSFVFRTSDEPNMELEAVWFTGRAYRVIGSATVRLRTEDRRITVALATDRDRYEPGDSAMITVRTTDAAGKPVPAAVLLRGIDEKLIAMDVAAFADPIELLYRHVVVGLRSGPVVSHEVWASGSDGKGGATGGGDGDEDERTDFADALALRLVTTDSDGRATVTWNLPDDITSWRIAATAITAGRRAGATTVLVPVGLPFFADATIAPEYLVGDRVSIRLRAFGSALRAGTAVRFTVSSSTLDMTPLTVTGRAFDEVLVPLPALVAGTQRVTIAATSTAGSDRLVRTFTVVESRLEAGRRATVPITTSITPPGGAGLTRLVLADAGRARYLELLLGLATPAGRRSDELLASAVARRVLAADFGLEAADLPPAPAFDRGAYQAGDGGLALLPYASADLELTTRALIADPDALFAASVTPWLEGIAGERSATIERRAVALAGLAALGEPVIGSLTAIVEDPAAGGRTQLWAAIGLALLGERAPAGAVQRSLVGRWGERRGDQVRLRISGDAEEVSQATELLAMLAAALDDPLAADALAYVVAVPPAEDLPALTEATVVARLCAGLTARPAVVAVIEGGTRTTVDIPAGEAVTIEVLPGRRSAMRLEPVSGAAAVTATWEEPVAGPDDLGAVDPDLGLTRTVTPASPIAATRLVWVQLELAVRGPGRDGVVEVTEPVPSGLAVLESSSAGRSECGQDAVTPARVEGQRVVFVVSLARDEGDGDGYERPVVPGTFCLGYLARVVSAGTYAWQPAVARQSMSPGMVVTSRASTVELR